jgi:hypothetical protein
VKPLDASFPDEYNDYADVFSKEEAGTLPDTSQVTHIIRLVDGKEPPYRPLYNLSANELSILRKYLEDSQAKGWIQPSTSPAGAPVLFVPKPDGSLCLYIDYRGLNEITKKDRYLLPLVDEMLDRLVGSLYFTKIDLRDAYHRIRINEGDEWKTAFRTRYGHFKYMVMLFGLCNAPATFQAYINQALSGILDIFCIVYLDDILIFSGTKAEHTDHVQQVLEHLQRFKLYIKVSKYDFHTRQVKFLGFLVGAEGVMMDPS